MLLASWRRHLTAQRTSPAALATYSASAHQLDDFLAEQSMLLEVCERDRSFAGRRDDAIVRMRIDAGARREGSRTRYVPIGAQTI